jgi:di/tricarboxylate transporter
LRRVAVFTLWVMEPRRIRFGDYRKLGLPLVALFAAVAIVLVPVFWPL